MKKPIKEAVSNKVALNVCREVAPNKFQIYQIYGDLTIPLLGYRRQGEFIERPAKSVYEAFERLNREYYE